MANAVGALDPAAAGDAGVDALLPPEVEITSPEWYDQIDPDDATFEVTGEVSRAPGLGHLHLPRPASPPATTRTTPRPRPGDFQEVVTDADCDTPIDGDSSRRSTSTT